MRKTFWLVVILAAAVLAGAIAIQQSKPGAESSGTSGTATSAEFRYVGTVREVMHMIIDPAADVLFDAVVINVTADGIEEKRPQTDDEWDNIEHGAIALAEAANLIKMAGRPIARSEEMNIDPEGPELPPSEIAAKLTRDRQAWNKYADAMQDAAIQALTLARAKDSKGFFLVGETIDAACDGCHVAYWYPDDLESQSR